MVAGSAAILTAQRAKQEVARLRQEMGEIREQLSDNKRSSEVFRNAMAGECNAYPSSLMLSSKIEFLC